MIKKKKNADKLQKAIQQIIEEVSEDICNNYCKYGDTEDENCICDAIRIKGACPLDRLQ